MLENKLKNRNKNHIIQSDRVISLDIRPYLVKHPINGVLHTGRPTKPFIYYPLRPIV